MSDQSITPAERPTHNPANAKVVDVLSHVRYGLQNLAGRVGDLERTIRLSSVAVTAPQGERLGGLLDDGATLLKVAAVQAVEATAEPQGETP